MAKYSDIKGFTVQTLASDTATSGIAGATWASGGALNAARGWGGRSGAGTQTAAQAAAGSGPSNAVEHYDGSSWTETTEVNTARSSASHGGIQTSSMVVGGWLAPGNSDNVETWNGSAWTEVNEINTARRQAGMSTSGNSTSSIYFAGYSTAYLDIAESWNGSSWSEVSDLNTPRSSLTATDKSSTAALGIAGYRGPPTADRTKFVEEWNGSTWTEITDINSERMDLGCGGSYTDCIVFGGTDTARSALTEHWDGSSWTEVADMATATTEVGGTGSSTAGLVFGGSTPPYTTTTQEFTAPSVFSQITEGQLYYNSTANAFKETLFDVPAGSWSSGGTYNTARYGTMSGGDTSAAIIAGGYKTASPAGYQTLAELYNGTSWSEHTDINTGRGFGASGTQTPSTSALIFGGASPPVLDNTELWNGSSWAEQSDLNTAGVYMAGAGSVYTAVLCATGNRPPSKTQTELFDGTSWTEVAEVNTARPEGAAGTGTSTAALIAGGTDPSSPPGGKFALVESWNGSSWTEITDINTARAYMASAGSPVNSIIGGGNSSPPVGNYLTVTEGWNGSAWTEVADMATARYGGNTGTGTGGTNLLFAGGDTSPPTVVGTTEEWTVNLSNKTITAS